MSNNERSLRVCLLVLAMAILAGVSLATLSRSGSEVADRNSANRREFHALLRSGVGTEVYFASQGASQDQTRASIDSVDKFIASRSGMKLDGDFKEKIASLEERVQNGAARRITVDQATDIFIKTMTNRIRRLTNDEIDQAVLIMSTSGYSSSSEVGADRTLRVRGNGAGTAADKFVSYAKLLRDSAGSPQILLPLGTIARQRLAQELHHRLDHLAAAIPDVWAGGSTDGLTPTQAVIMAYSAAADDYLWYSKHELRDLMKSMEALGRKSSSSFPSSDGRFPYGTNGYIFRSPLELVLDRQALSDLVDGMQEGSKK